MRVFIASTVICLTVLFLSTNTFGQSTSFSYQGDLQLSSSPANGNFDFEFLLFDAASGGSQIGTTQTRSNVAIAEGIFTVSLDFGAVFSNNERFMEIRVRQAGGGGFTTLEPRTRIASSPYAVRSVSAGTADQATNATNAVNAINASNATTAATATNALSLGGVAANQYVLTTDPRMSDPRPPTAGSGNYIQNSPSLQAASNFNISGTGRANILQAETQFNIGASRVLSASAAGFNLFTGLNSGGQNTTGTSNAFVGASSGFSNTTGSGNSFIGRSAGFFNTTGSENSFVGVAAGAFNTTGGNNSFFGVSAGKSNTTGASNSFFGVDAGDENTTGFFNSFVGAQAGVLNTTGGSNSFFGWNAGSSNVTGSNNTIIGNSANVGSDNLTFATALGASSIVTANNTVVLGRTNDTVSAPGTMVVGNSLVKRGDVNFYSNSGNMDLYLQAAGATTGVNFGISSDPTLFIAHYDGTTYQNRIVLTSTGTVRILTLGAAGSTPLCLNGSQELATCSSSMRYKQNVGQFSQGLSFINKLRPISFDWTDGGLQDVGFGAEDIAKIDDRFVIYNDKGEVEGVKYDRLSVAFVNAFKEQQSLIETQQRQISELLEANRRQQAQIDALTKLFCSGNPTAEFCRPRR